MKSFTRFRTNYLLWAAASWCVFIVLGFVDPVASVSKCDNSLWAAASRFASGAYHCSTSEILFVILLAAMMRALPAILLGWAIHATIVVIESQFQRRRAKHVVARPSGDKLLP